MSDSSSSTPSSPPADAASSSAPEISPAERIAELNAIDASITTLLASASSAIGILANTPAASARNSVQSSAAARAAFESSASTFFATLSSIEVRLKRNIYALEEAGLIRAGDKGDERRGASAGASSSEGAGVGRAAGGALDPSWLNARARDAAEEGMRKELLQKAKEFVARMDAKPRADDDDDDDDVEMG